MSKKLFLLNSMFIALDDAVDPTRDPAFPLTEEQCRELTVDGLIEIFKEKIQIDPQFAKQDSIKLRALCALLNRIGRVNCVQLHWDGYGISGRYGGLPEHYLEEGLEAQGSGQFTDALANDLIWSKLPDA